MRRGDDSVCGAVFREGPHIRANQLFLQVCLRERGGILGALRKKSVFLPGQQHPGDHTLHGTDALCDISVHIFEYGGDGWWVDVSSGGGPRQMQSQ